MEDICVVIPLMPLRSFSDRFGFRRLCFFFAPGLAFHTAADSRLSSLWACYRFPYSTASTDGQRLSELRSDWPQRRWALSRPDTLIVRPYSEVSFLHSQS